MSGVFDYIKCDPFKELSSLTLFYEYGKQLNINIFQILIFHFPYWEPSSGRVCGEGVHLTFSKYN